MVVIVRSPMITSRPSMWGNWRLLMNQNLTNSTPSRARGISPSRPAFILLLAFWLALLFSLGEVALDGIRKNLLNRIIGLGPDLVWKIPLADTFIFMIPAVILALVAWVRPKGLPDSLSTFVFASLGFLAGWCWRHCICSPSYFWRWGLEPNWRVWYLNTHMYFTSLWDDRWACWSWLFY